MTKTTNNTIQSFWIAIGSFSSFAISIVSVAILSRYFTKEDYGTYRQVIYIYNTLLVVFSAGLPRVFSYYLPRYELEKGKDIVLKISKVLLLTGMIFSVTLFLGAPLISVLMNNPDIKDGLRLFSIVPMFMLPSLGVEGILATYKKTLYIAVYNILSRLVMLAFIVLPILFIKVDYHYSLIGWGCSSIFTFFLAIYFKNIPFKGLLKVKSGLSLKEILTYSLPLLVASLGSIAIKSADQFFVSRYFGAEVFAEYSNGFMEIPIVGMITFSVSAVLMPLFSKIDNDSTSRVEIINLWKSAIMKSAMIIYPIIVFFWYYAPEIMTILYSSAYIESATYFRIAILTNFFNIIMFAPLLLSLGKTKFYSNILLLFAGFAWVGAYFVIIIFNTPTALAYFSVFRAISLTLIAFYYASKCVNTNFLTLFPIRKLLGLFLYSSICLYITNSFVSLLFINYDSIFYLIVNSIAFFIFVISISKVVKLDYINLVKPLFMRIFK